MSQIDQMSGLEFERYVARLLARSGYLNINLTEKYDFGVDIIAVKDGITWGIQVKRCTGLVRAKAVRQVVTGLKKYRCDQAMVITNGCFSQVARELARVNECQLIDGSVLLRMLRQNAKSESRFECEAV